MRSPNKSRSRNKNNRNRNNNNNIGNIVNRVFDSNGPEGRVRGTPTQLIEKYETLARDAQLSGDRVEAENFSQHAEHYIRLLAKAQEDVAREQARRQAEQDARNAQRAEKQEKDGEKKPELEADTEAAEAGNADDEKPKSKSKSKKSDTNNVEAQEGFDAENAPDFLKVIND